MVEFTKEELFFIEQEFDLKAAIVMKNIHSILEQFLHVNGIIKEGLEKDEILKMIMHLVQETHRISDMVDSIRKKCEDERKVSK